MLDHPSILRAARQRPLRPGEIEALSLYISGLERQVRTMREAASSTQCVELSLSPDGAALNAILPGAPPHSVRLPLKDPALAIDFLLRALRARTGQPNPIGTPGAPTAADLEALRAAYRGKISRAKAPSDVSLEDLGL